MGRKQLQKGVREVYDTQAGNSVCLICDHKVPGCHLGNMEKHLKRKHPAELKTVKENKGVPIEPPRKKTKVSVEYDKRELLDAWLDIVTVEGRPFLLLDSKSLRTIVKPLFDALEIDLLTSATVGDAIRKRAEEKRNEIRQLLDGRMISIKIDAATKHRHRVVGINTQVIIDGEIVVKTLSMEEMNASHHSKNIKAHVLKVLQR